MGGGWPGARDWIDVEESYETNEIAINWSGALIYALAGFANMQENPFNPEPTPTSKPEIVYGDVNDDGYVDSTD